MLGHFPARPPYFLAGSGSWPFVPLAGCAARLPLACPVARSRGLLIFEWLLLMAEFCPEAWLGCCDAAASALPSPFTSAAATRLICGVLLGADLVCQSSAAVFFGAFAASLAGASLPASAVTVIGFCIPFPGAFPRTPSRGLA